MDVSTDPNDHQQDHCKKKTEFQNPTAVSSIDTNRYAPSTIEICEPRCLEFHSFLITNFNIIVSTIRDWIQRIWTRPRDWQAVAQITRSSLSVKLSVSFF
jgi:hypothetical protein